MSNGSPALILQGSESQLVSAKWYYFETVYSAYTKYGRLLWRAAVDSSPDYDARNQ